MMSSKPDRLRGKRVLVVEDEGLIAAMLVDMLDDLGITVVGPASTVAAGKHLAETADFDAAVLDVNLAGQSIAPVAEMIRQRKLPVILTTGYAENAISVPHDALLDKPYTAGKLALALASVFGPDGG